jgi:hypothetical protein
MRKLDEIVREFYIERLHMSQLDNRYPMFLQMAVSGLKDLHMDIKTVVTEAVLDINDNDTVDLPSNFIDYLVIGVIDGGRIASIGENRNIAPRSLDDCGNLVTSITDDVEYSFIGINSSHYTKDGQFNGRYYGAGGGGAAFGNYKIYKDRGYISLSGVTSEAIVMRYYATLEQLDGNFMVDEYFTEALKDWMWWKYVQNQRSYDMGTKQMAEVSYNKQKKKAEKRTYRFNITTFVNAFRTGYRSTPRI